MTDSDIEKEQILNSLIKDENLARKVRRHLEERPVFQKDYLNRGMWQKEISRRMQNETTLVVILDLVGGSKLQEAFPERMQGVIDGIDDWKSQYTPDHKFAGTFGRRIEVQERLPGEDEVVFFICPKPEEDSNQLLEQLNQNIKSATGVDAVYIGASENPAGGDVSTALRAANIALKRKKKEIKELSEGQRIYTPGVISMQNHRAVYEKQVIDLKELEITIPQYSNSVITENVVEQLRSIRGNMTLLSPQSMKEINTELGMKGGDQILVNLTNKINEILEAKGLTRVKIYKIGTIFVVPNVEFTQDDLNAISGLLPHGLTYNNLSL